MTSHLLSHGIVHSVSDPYATALLVADGVIAWLGADESAARVAGDAVPGTDLAGAVVAPCFVEPAAEATVGVASALQRGTAVVTLLAGPADAVAPSGAPLQTVRYRHADSADSADSAGVWAPARAAHDAEALTDLLVRATEAGEQAYLVPEEGEREAAQAAVLAALRTAAGRLGDAALGRLRHRLLLTGPVTPEDRALLAATATSVTVRPDQDGVLRAPVGSLLADAVPVCLASGAGHAEAGGPWAAVRAAVSHPVEAERVSARSAFTAATRTGLRALPDVPAATVTAAPRLTVSVPATFAVWRSEAVTVQAPDGRVAAWSTDTRAGTPLLPALDADTPLPAWSATWVDGAPVAAAE